MPPGSRKSTHEELLAASQAMEQEMNVVKALKRLSIGNSLSYDPDLPLADTEFVDLNYLDIHCSSSLSSRSSDSSSSSLSKEQVDSSDVIPEEDYDDVILESNKLMWVPATAHPKLAPDNFRKYVKATVEDITTKLDHTRSKRSSLSTESTDNQNQEVFRSEIEKRPSLRELTTELENLSHLAGMDSTDAVTLARTLSSSTLGYTEVEKEYGASDLSSLSRSNSMTASQRRRSSLHNEVKPETVDENLPLAKENGLKRARWTTYRKSGSSKYGRRQPEPLQIRQSPVQVEPQQGEIVHAQQRRASAGHVVSVQNPHVVPVQNPPSPTEPNQPPGQGGYSQSAQAANSHPYRSERAHPQPAHPQPSLTPKNIPKNTHSKSVISHHRRVTPPPKSPSAELPPLPKTEKSKKPGWNWLNRSKVREKESNHSRNRHGMATLNRNGSRSSSSLSSDESVRETTPPSSPTPDASGERKTSFSNIFRFRKTSDPVPEEPSNFELKSFSKATHNASKPADAPLPPEPPMREPIREPIQEESENQQLVHNSSVKRVEVADRIPQRAPERIPQRAPERIEMAERTSERVERAERAERAPEGVESERGPDLPSARPKLARSVQPLERSVERSGAPPPESVVPNTPQPESTLDPKQQELQQQQAIRQRQQLDAFTPTEVLRKNLMQSHRNMRPNQPLEMRDSAFGFPLPPVSRSTLIMLDYRFPIHVERAVYRLSHIKLADPKRPLYQQVLLSNFMYAYLNLVNHTLYLQQQQQDQALMHSSLDSKLRNTFSVEQVDAEVESYDESQHIEEMYGGLN